MSIRIYALAKELEVPNKELIDFINSREYGVEIKSPSSTIANLYADAIKADFIKSRESAEAPKEEPEKPQEEAPREEKPVGEKAPETIKSAPKVSIPLPPKRPPQAVKPAPQAAKPVPQAAKPEPPAAEVSIKAPEPKAPIKPPVVSMPKAPSVPPSIPGFRKPSAPQQRKTPLPVPNISFKSAPSVPPRDVSPDVVVKGDFSSAPKTPSVPPPLPERQEVKSEASQGDTAKLIQIKPPIIVRDFAKAIGLKPFRLISELMDMGIFASMNLAIEENVAVRIAKKHGFELDIKHRGEQQREFLKKQAEKAAAAKSLQEDIKNYVPRPPIVCILGHVDHGKTTLLDAIRHTNVVAGEAGGITQHTAAYQVECNGKKITFLDTPGHAAFSKMRERGANVTDIAILVVAADDGFMPQTDEALNFAQKAGVPVVVAINKIDAKGANVDKVKQQMQKRGITSEDWGGETLCCGISALKGQNLEKLLELVLLQAEMMELKANPKAIPEGIVIESQVEPGRGATATVIVRAGTLKQGDVLICNGNWCKVRALLDDKGKKIQSATPSTPAVVMGWSGAPVAGDTFSKVANDRVARKAAEEYVLEQKKKAAEESAPKPASIEDLMAAIENKDHKVFKCIVKSDVSGTTEALVACLKEIKSDKVGMEVIGSSVGQITKNDVVMAATSHASIVAFNVKQENGVSGEAKHSGVEIISHDIIYELINQVRDAMKDMLDPELRENKLGAAEVRQIFNISHGGKIAGCMVTEGTVKREKFARILRKGEQIPAGKINDLKRFKEDVAEVRAGYECGISLSKFAEFEAGDIIECYEVLKVRPDL